MWIEIVVGVVVLSVILGAVSRAVASRRGTTPRSDEATGGQQGRTWSATDPLDAAFPVERTPRERRIGDAAFVDGLVVGHYLAPFRPAEEREAVQPDRPELTSDGDDGSTVDAWASLEAAPSDEPDDQTDLDLDLDLDADAGFAYGGGSSSWDGPEEDGDDAGAAVDEFDDGFGFEDGLDDDDW